MTLFLRKLLNWFKLFVALDFMVVSVILVVSERQAFDEGAERWGALIAVGSFFFILGLILLTWFFHIFYKLRKIDAEKFPGALESVFYLKNPKFCAFMEGWSFNGFGTKFLTWSNRQSDGSIYATRWIILGFFPTFPLYRQRIRIVSEKDKMNLPGLVSTSRLTYEPFERVMLDRKVIRYTYVFYYLFFLSAIVLPLILGLIFIHPLTDHFEGVHFWWLILGYLIWGVFFIFLTELFNKKLFLKRN